MNSTSSSRVASTASGRSSSTSVIPSSAAFDPESGSVSPSLASNWRALTMMWQTLSGLMPSSTPGGRSGSDETIWFMVFHAPVNGAAFATSEVYASAGIRLLLPRLLLCLDFDHAHNAQNIAAPDFRQILLTVTRRKQPFGDFRNACDILHAGHSAAAVPIKADPDMVRPGQPKRMHDMCDDVIH